MAGTRKLSEKRRAFVAAYIAEDFNGTRAYQLTYKCTAAAARANAAKLLANTSVQAYLQECLEARRKDFKISADRVLQEYARVAFFDSRNLFDADGKPKKINELDADTAAAIAGLEVEELNAGAVKLGVVRKYKIANKIPALDSVARHLGMFGADTREINITVNRRQFSPTPPTPPPVGSSKK